MRNEVGDGQRPRRPHHARQAGGIGGEVSYSTPESKAILSARDNGHAIAKAIDRLVAVEKEVERG